MTKSFKDNYAEKVAVQVTPSTTDAITPDAVTITPTVLPPLETEEIKIGEGLPMHEHVIPPQPVRVELTEEIAEVLTEQREQAAKVLESVMKTNTKIANSVSKLVKSNVDVNDKLVEAILSLTEKIGLLETKLEAIENLEIPTPIVQVNAPNTKVHKEIHRDTKGIITHITESEVPADEDE